MTRKNCGTFAHDGYIYVKDRRSKDGSKIFWRCQKKDTGRNEGGARTYCNGRLWTTSEGLFLSIRCPHSCRTVGSAVQLERAEIMTQIKRKAVETMEKPHEIKIAASRNISSAARGIFPSQDTIRKVVNRARDSGRPIIPLTRGELIIPENYAQYTVNPGQTESFLLGDSGIEDPGRILIFGRDHHITWAGQMKEVFMDGTFILTPPLFYQIFVILARRGNGHGFVFPVVFCLLPNKRKSTYIKLFSMLKQMWPEFSPDSISVDFEIAIHQALRAEFPEANINGCLFHLVQNLRKHLSECHLLSRYNSDADFALHARMITSLAFVPEEEVEFGLNFLDGFLPAELKPILKWFTITYVGRVRANGVRATPMFPIPVWSVYRRTILGADRTNNFAEACHKRVQQGFNAAHPTIWKFISYLKEIQRIFDIDYEHFVAGHSDTRKRKRYVEADARILNKVQSYDRAEISEFLRGLSHNYEMV
jgi:hypothetical protein